MAAPPDDHSRTARAGRLASDGRPRDLALDGALLRTLFADAASLLQRHIEALNAINVFPVPDGDTGTNMHLTLRAAIEELARTKGDDIAAAAQALAHGALMGARGNSGVILSQVLRGFATAVDGRHEADAASLIRGFAAARAAAYEALSQPKEGTILTVIREADEAVAAQRPATALAVLGPVEGGGLAPPARLDRRARRQIHVQGFAPQRAHQPLQDDRQAQAAGIDHARFLEHGQQLGRPVDGLLGRRGGSR